MRHVVGVTLLLVVGSAQAALVTSSFSGTEIDFEGEAPVSNVNGPVQIGGSIGMDVTVTGDPNNGLFVFYRYDWGLLDNGDWSGASQYVGTNAGRPGSLLFAFNDGPVSQVGAFMNHAPNQGADLIISAYDSEMNLLESYNITSLANISTPGEVDGGGFRGVTRNSFDISYFEVYGYVPVVDDLTFSVVPIPAAVWLFGSGLGLLGWMRRKQTV
jgi:hypothetical protein